MTLCISHLPLHPSCFLGYAAAILAKTYDLDVIDLNAELHLKNAGRLKAVLTAMDRSAIVSDFRFLHPFYKALDVQIDGYYAAISWNEYHMVYVTPPSWFPMVPAEAVLRLSHAIRGRSPDTAVFFMGNSLGSWTSEAELCNAGVQAVHLNDLFSPGGTAAPVRYDDLPTPVYEGREKYLFDLLPFALKHGCYWEKCRFCSLSKGWNSGYLERSPEAAIKELELLIDRYRPGMLFCRDHSLNGRNLVEFCRSIESFRIQWCGQSRADLSEKKLKALRNAGCSSIYFGLESGSDRMLRALNKGIVSRQMSEFIKRMNSTGILPVPSLIIGAPGEKEADFEMTIRFLTDHSSCLEVVNVYPFMETPASELASQGKGPDKNTQLRLFRFIQICQDLGLKVCLGEQSIEYTVLKRLNDGRWQ